MTAIRHSVDLEPGTLAETQAGERVFLQRVDPHTTRWVRADGGSYCGLAADLTLLEVGRDTALVDENMRLTSELGETVRLVARKNDEIGLLERGRLNDLHERNLLAAEHNLIVNAVEDAIPERVSRRSARAAFAAIRKAIA